MKHTIVSATIFRLLTTDYTLDDSKHCSITIYIYKTVNDSRIVTPSDNFSPESGGKVNPSRAMEAIRTHGTIKLKK